MLCGGSSEGGSSEGGSSEGGVADFEGGLEGSSVPGLGALDLKGFLILFQPSFILLQPFFRPLTIVLHLGKGIGMGIANPGPLPWLCVLLADAVRITVDGMADEDCVGEAVVRKFCILGLVLDELTDDDEAVFDLVSVLNDADEDNERVWLVEVSERDDDGIEPVTEADCEFDIIEAAVADPDCDFVTAKAKGSCEFETGVIKPLDADCDAESICESEADGVITPDTDSDDANNAIDSNGADNEAELETICEIAVPELGFDGEAEAGNLNICVGADAVAAEA